MSNKKLTNVKKLADITGLTRRTIYKYLNGTVLNIKEDNKSRLIGAVLTYNRESTFQKVINLDLE
ncbi:MAG: helix-turn-helix domain-containing protein [Candidatus Helarchaeota archaeon]